MWEAADGSGAGPRQAAGPGLVGRQDVLTQLRRAVEDAARGRGRLLLLTGEAGIGKTAVAAEAAAGAPVPRPAARPPPLRTRRCDRTGNGRQGRQL